MERFKQLIYRTLLSCLMLFSNFAFSSPSTPFSEPNIIVFDPSQTSSEISRKINNLYARQRDNQFGEERYALLFKPGIYEVDVRVGYYTQVIGLGRSPDDVTIVGAIRTQDDTMTQPIDSGPGALNNFWRSVENISVIPTLGSLNRLGAGIPKGENVWAVSQAAPMRSVHIKNKANNISSGSLRLFDIGWSSGGFMANSKIDGYVEAGSQQQWISRNSEWSNWKNGNWNIIEVGCKSKEQPRGPSSAQSNAWNNYPYTSVQLTPVIAEKPTLILDKNNQFAVLTPNLRVNTSGVQWGEGVVIPLSEFYVTSVNDTADTINAALSSGKHILFTPGIYQLSTSLNVIYPNTVLLGIGLPSLCPMNGTSAITVADVDGVKVAGFMIDAGPVNSSTLVQIGEKGDKSDHSGNPTMLYDIFCRVGGVSSEVTKATTCITINSCNVVCDNLWIWRADHGINEESVGWTKNTADHGLIVNGDNVTVYGLAVEHFQKTQTIWNGENGQVYFYQCELPYDPPTQADWKDGAVDGYAGYKVADHVKQHTAYGVGIYSYFRDASDIYLDNAIVAPTQPGISFVHMVTVWLNGNRNNSYSGIRHIINGRGEPAISIVAQSTKISALEE
jgi:hypothetical protein